MTYSIFPLCVGINQTDQGIMTYLRGYGQRILLPIYAFLIRADGGRGKKILVDTGMEEFMIPEGAESELGFKVMEFEEALEVHGLAPEDIDLVIQTHLHNDHCENTYKCTKAKVIIQDAELEFARNPHPLDHRYFDDLLDGLDFVVVEGDTEIEPGLTLLFTPGHTVGGQSVMVETKAGKAIITGFCANAKNFPSSGPAVTPGVHIDAVAAYESAQRVKELAEIILPCHDPELGRTGRYPVSERG